MQGTQKEVCFIKKNKALIIQLIGYDEAKIIKPYSKDLSK